MIHDTDVWQAAKLMIDQHGADAVMSADARVEDLRGEGDDAGAAVWRSIVHAIEQLQREAGPGDAVNRTRNARSVSI